MQRRKELPASPPGAAFTGDPARWRILDGARRYFFAHGFRGVSMDDLAAELGMSKKTLYSRFDTKQRLLEAVIDEQFRRVSEECAGILAAKDREFPTTLQDFLACIQRHTAAIQPPFLKDMRQEAPETFHRVERLRCALIERYFGELMRRGRVGGFIRKDIPAVIIIEILLAAVQAIVNPVRMEEMDLTVKSGCALITKVVLEGALAPGAKAKEENLKL